MRIAIVHDWLVTYTGAEHVLGEMLQLYPEAELYSLIDFVPEEQRAFLGGRPVHTSFVQRLPRARKWYQRYLPILPYAIEQFDLSDFDLVISSSHAVAKGVLTSAEQLHICYCYTPTRYAWDLHHQYLRQANLLRGPKSWLARWILHRFRIWDLRTANGVDAFVGISRYVARRIRKTYRRDAAVIYPPVDVDAFTLQPEKEDFYLAASRLVPYKRMDLIVEAFRQMPERRLVVIGDGAEFRKIRARCTPNIQMMGYQPFAVLKQLMDRARAFVFAGEEDFGIVLLEAQACGTPVIAYGKGGVTETVRGLDHARPTGLFFDRQTPEAICAAVDAFERERERIRPEHCRENAERFAPDRFRREFRAFVDDAWQRFVQERDAPGGEGEANGASGGRAPSAESA